MDEEHGNLNVIVVLPENFNRVPIVIGHLIRGSINETPRKALLISVRLVVKRGGAVVFTNQNCDLGYCSCQRLPSNVLIRYLHQEVSIVHKWPGTFFRARLHGSVEHDDMRIAEQSAVSDFTAAWWRIEVASEMGSLESVL